MFMQIHIYSYFYVYMRIRPVVLSVYICTHVRFGCTMSHELLRGSPLLASFSLLQLPMRARWPCGTLKCTEDVPLFIGQFPCASQASRAHAINAHSFLVCFLL